MSTLQTNPHHPHTSRRGAVAVALGALIAIGATILILALTGANHTASQSAAIQPPAATANAVPASAPRGYFRDPTTHALLRVRTKGCDAAQLRVEKSCARP